MIEISEKKLSGFKFIDLFAGIGGFRLALESFGAECVYSSEWDRFAQETYYENYGEMPDGDITLVDETQIPDHDILCAGFPCQAFSISGNQRGFEDSRGTLFFDVARIVNAKRPKVVFMENVKNFARHDNGNTLLVVRKTMEELGYDFYAQVLKAVSFNIPQNRERIYMVCFRKDLHIPSFSFPRPVELTRHLEDLLLPGRLTGDCVIKRSDLNLSATDIGTSSDKPVRIGYVGKGGQGERIYSPKGIAITLSAHGGGVFSKTGGYYINGQTRKLALRECARIMGFPDTFIINSNINQAYTQFGNSVVVDVLQYIIMELISVFPPDTRFETKDSGFT